MRGEWQCDQPGYPAAWRRVRGQPDFTGIFVYIRFLSRIKIRSLNKSTHRSQKSVHIIFKLLPELQLYQLVIQLTHGRNNKTKLTV